MVIMSNNKKCPSRNFGDSSQLINSILGFGATWHMTPEVSDFIPGSIWDTHTHIEAADEHYFTEI